MKYICLLFLLAVAVYAEEKYTDENDNLDIEGVVKNPDSLKAFVNCFMDKAECDPVSADFKKDLPEAVQTACDKCTDKQKHIFKVFLDGFESSLPADEFKAFINKYDSENKHFGPLREAIAKY